MATKPLGGHVIHHEARDHRNPLAFELDGELGGLLPVSGQTRARRHVDGSLELALFDLSLDQSRLHHVAKLLRKLLLEVLNRAHSVAKYGALSISGVKRHQPVRVQGFTPAPSDLDLELLRPARR
jgi:hypothetical protein